MAIFKISKMRVIETRFDNGKLILSENDENFINNAATGMRTPATKQKDINKLTLEELNGKVSYCISARKYDLAEKLLILCVGKSDNIIDLHFCYNYLIEITYKQRESLNYLNMCIEYCKKDIELYPKFIKEWDKKYGNGRERMQSNSPALKKHYNEMDRLKKDREKLIGKEAYDMESKPYITSFERLAIIYEKQGNIEDAIKICELAIKYDLKSSTKTGYSGRLEKLKSQQDKK